MRRYIVVVIAFVVTFGSLQTHSFAQSLLPEAVDNSTLKYFPPLINQMGGSCAQASAIGYVFTYEVNRLLDRSASAPENRFSYLYTWNMLNDGIDQGGTGVDGLSLASQNGIISEADFPKQTSSYDFCWATGYDKYYRAMHYKIKRFVVMDATSEDDLLKIKQYLYDKNEPGSGSGGIVTFSSQASGWEFDDSYSGPSGTHYKSLLLRLATSGPHAMTIVGYDDLVEFTTPAGQVTKGAFIVVNSWGSWSHDEGRFYLPYWFFLQDRAVVGDLSRDVTGVEPLYSEPLVVFKVGVDFSSRDDLSFNIGVSHRSSDTRPMHDYTVPIANHQGGDHPMQGSRKTSQIEMGFDFTDYVARLEGMKEPNFFLTINNAKRGNVEGRGTLTSFEVLDYREDRDNPKRYVCTSSRGSAIESGQNIFNVPTVAPRQCSYSRVLWLAPSGNPASSPLILRTAGGKYSKLKFSDYDRSSGSIRLKYVYNPETGSRNLKAE